MIFVPPVRVCHVPKVRSNPLLYEYIPPTPPRVVGMIKILSSRDVRISPDLCDDGVEIRFNNVNEVNDLIERLIKLRDDMLAKGDI